MKKGFLSCLVLSFLAGTLANANNCQNPVFQYPEDWGANGALKLSSLDLASAPVPAPSNPPTCKHFSQEAGAELSCCTNSTITKINEAFSTAQSLMAEAKAKIERNDFGKMLVSMVEDMSALICKFTQCPPSLKKTIDKYAKLLDQNTVKLQLTQLQCTSALLTYTQGMMCFACETNWEKFLDNKTKVIKLSQETCDYAVHACSPVFSAASAVLLDSQKMVEAIVEEVSGFDLNFTIGEQPGMCGGTFSSPGNCTDHLCHRMLNGFVVPPFAWDAHVPQPPLPEQQSSRRLSTKDLESSEATNAWLSAALTARTHSALSSLHHSLSAPARALSSLSPAASAAPASTETSHNQYVPSGGYAVYAAGCADLPSCPLPPKTHSLPTLVILAICGGCAAVALVTVFGALWYRHRASASSSHYYTTL